MIANIQLDIDLLGKPNNNIDTKYDVRKLRKMTKI